MGGGPHKPEHLLVILPFPEPTEILERIKKNHPYIRITFKRLLFTDTPSDGSQTIPPEIYHDTTLLITLSALPLPSQAPNLRLIHFTSAGTNHIAHSPIYTSTDIPLTTSSGIHGPQISEWVLLTALAHSHHYSLLHDWQRARHWGNGGNEKILLSLRDKVGQRLGVLGYGSIGRQVGRVAKAMGMDVIAYTARPRPTPESKRDRGFIVPGTGDPEGEFPSAWFSGLDKQSLHTFLHQDIDLLLISVPLTQETDGFIGEAEMDILGSTTNAFVSNISRGQILDQTALLTRLRKYADNDPLDGGDGGGGLRGAALDVTDPEPLPKEDPLWDAPNCIITPHISGLGEKYLERSMQVFEVNLDKEEKGEPLINVVNRERGY
ncbi:MAG: hypothetical protein Q9217_003203 [Psora testacea]